MKTLPTVSICSHRRHRKPAPALVPPGFCVTLLIILVILVSVAGCTPPIQVTVTAGPEREALRDAGTLATSPGEPYPTISPSPKAEPPAILSSGSAGNIKLASSHGTEGSHPEKAPVPTPTKVAPASHPPTRIVVEANGLDAPVVSIGWVVSADGMTTEWQTADFAAGFHIDSALPGRVGNTVLSGHHNIKGEVFERLHELQRGEIIILFVGDAVYEYRIVDRFILLERGASEEQRRQNAHWIAPTSDNRLTLVTCWPDNDNSHRVIVVARPRKD